MSKKRGCFDIAIRSLGSMMLGGITTIVDDKQLIAELRAAILTLRTCERAFVSEGEVAGPYIDEHGYDAIATSIIRARKVVSRRRV